MSKIKPIFTSEQEFTGMYCFKCPGCGDKHRIPTSKPQENGAIWQFNGNVNKPTFSPSILATSGHYAMPNTDTCWCTYNKEQIEKGGKPSSFSCYRCHSFVTDGKIQFLSDCTHPLAGQTVELPEME